MAATHRHAVLIKGVPGLVVLALVTATVSLRPVTREMPRRVVAPVDEISRAAPLKTMLMIDMTVPPVRTVRTPSLTGVSRLEAAF